MKLARWMTMSRTTTRDLARRLAVPKRSVENWRQGRYVPRAKVLLRIEKITSGLVSPRDFY